MSICLALSVCRGSKEGLPQPCAAMTVCSSLAQIESVSRHPTRHDVSLMTYHWSAKTMQVKRMRARDLLEMVPSSTCLVGVVPPSCRSTLKRQSNTTDLAAYACATGPTPIPHSRLPIESLCKCSVVVALLTTTQCSGTIRERQG